MNTDLQGLYKECADHLDAFGYKKYLLGMTVLPFIPDLPDVPADTVRPRKITSSRSSRSSSALVLAYLLVHYALD